MRAHYPFLLLGGLAALRAIGACVGDDALPGSDRDGSAGEAGSAGETGGTGNGPANGPSPLDQYHQGTRLVPNVVTVGGAPYFLDWWDSTLKVHCTFQQLSKAGLRCVPSVPRATAFRYADPACSTRTAYIFDSARVCASAPALVNVTRECDPEVVATDAVVTGKLFQKGAGGCSIDPQGSTPLSFRLASMDLDPTAWVGATVRDGTDDTGTGFKAELTQGDDGSLGFYRWAPKTIEAECAIGSPFADAGAGCYPTERSAFMGYADPACSKAIYGEDPSCRPASRVGARVTSTSADACAPAVTGLRFETLGARFDGGASWALGSDGGCTRTSQQAAGFLGDGEIDTAAIFGDVTSAQVDAGAPLTAIYWVTRSGVRARAGWYDDAQQTACAFATATDGATRCLPVAGAPLSVYTDASCTTKTRLAIVAPPSVAACLDDAFGKPCPPPDCRLPLAPKFLVDDVLTTSCTTRREVYAPGVSTPIYRLADPSMGTCERVDRPDVAAHVLTVVPPTAFVDGVATFAP